MKDEIVDVAKLISVIALILIFAVADFLHADGAAPVPIEFLLRNGLTDAQVTKILTTDPNAIIHMNGSTWRNVEYNTARYNNVTNWLSVIGETNDFARLVVPLSQTNAVLTAQVSRLNAKIENEIAFLEQMKILCDQLAEKYPAQREEIMAIKAQLQARIEYLGGQAELGHQDGADDGNGGAEVDGETDGNGGSKVDGEEEVD